MKIKKKSSDALLRCSKMSLFMDMSRYLNVQIHGSMCFCTSGPGRRLKTLQLMFLQFVVERCARDAEVFGGQTAVAAAVLQGLQQSGAFGCREGDGQRR